MSNFALVSMGELLIDFTPLGISENQNPIFERNPGGGPANLACAAAKLGCRVAFVGKVGNDTFGRALREFIEENGVSNQALLLSDEYKTTLAFVHLDEHGDRSFSFYRKNGADTMLRFEEIDLSVLEGCRYFFCSSVMMAEGESRPTSFRMMEEARRRGIPVVFDPNLRLNLWESSEDAKEQITKALPLADIVKLSEEELFFLTGETDIPKGAALLVKEYHFKALLVTLGPKGSYAIVGDKIIETPAYPVKVVDTTAAGDSFTGGFLYRLLQTKKGISDCTRAELAEVLAFASAVGSLTTSRKGAINALPSLQEVETALAEQQ